MKDDNKTKSPAQIAELMGVNAMETHLFLCVGPDCCTEEQGMESWAELKQAHKQRFSKLSEARIYRTKVGCLRICKDGPIAVAYPQGKWFRGVTPEVMEDLLAYLDSGNPQPHPLEFTHHPLPVDKAGGDQ